MEILELENILISEICIVNLKQTKKMEKRIDINEIEPQAYKAMYALEGYLATSQLSNRTFLS